MVEWKPTSTFCRLAALQSRRLSLFGWEVGSGRGRGGWEEGFFSFSFSFYVFDPAVRPRAHNSATCTESLGTWEVVCFINVQHPKVKTYITQLGYLEPRPYLDVRPFFPLLDETLF